MKKIISLVIELFLLVIIPLSLTATASSIDGLNENLNALLLEKNISTEQILDMDKLYMTNYSERLITEYLPAKQGLSKLETGSLEEEYNLEMNRALLNYSNGIKVSLLSTKTYTKQYIDYGKLQYLFSEKAYWSVPGYDIYSDKGRFSLDGDNITDVSNYFNVSYSGIIISDDTPAFIKEGTKIQTMLSEKGETKVNDIKIFAYSPSLSFMYIEGDKTDYLIKLHDSTGTGKQYIPDIELFKLYSAKEAIEFFSKDRPNTVGKEKPTFETEALTLQENGLLYGNENGLDLLKPLTRIEAATMLLRALGESTTNEATVQTFADVPATHWGYGAAENAYSLGLIKGVGDDRFDPDDIVTGPQFATMVLRAGNHADFNWEEALNILISEGIISADDAATMDFFTRGDMAKIIYEAIEKGLF